MKNLRQYTILMLLLLSANLFAQQQQKPYQPEKALQAPVYRPENVSPPKQFRANVPKGPKGLQHTAARYGVMPPLTKPAPGKDQLLISKDQNSNLPFFIKGRIAEAMGKDKPTAEKAAAYLQAIKADIQIGNPEQEFRSISTRTDKYGLTHLKMQQTFNGVKVYGAEAILHEQDGDITAFNGRFYPTPELENVTPAITREAAEAAIRNDLPNFKPLAAMELKLLAASQQETELVIYHVDKNPEQEVLAWHSTTFPNVAAQWQYFIDAQTGEILHKFINTCHFYSEFDETHLRKHSCTAHNHDDDLVEETALVNGPATANAQNLLNNTVLIHTYEIGGTYYMYDGSRSMFNLSQSDLPEDPVGMIVTIDGMNTYPGNSSFQYEVLTTTNNVWNNKTAVSAHYNAGLAYKYFEDTHSRNSINGQGGSIYSLINIADENGAAMDNAFWNGQAMFYGNGNQVFTAPLAKALDVAGHEMSHGVVQTTANLEYQGQSGALNESFADIFGAMIDRDDWKMGEDIVSTSTFPGGGLRDLADPHNGGNQLGDPGYQPSHVNEMYNGSQDNGGVHINSGIPNKAFHLFATNSNVGKAKAEVVFYQALTEYLTMSSQFTDLRYAVVSSAEAIHGTGSAEAVAAASAFDAVGIPGVGPGNYEQEVEINPGEDYILSSDAALGALYVDRPDGSSVFFPLTETNILSKPSVIDNASGFVFIGDDNKMYGFDINWDTNETSEYFIQDEPIWRNVAISKDGSRLAALTTDFDNEIWIYDYNVGGDWVIHDLYNPTSAEGGLTTGDVLYADIMEFDFTGEYLMYDAFNRIAGTGGADIEYWDVGFLRVWDNNVGGHGDGYISKLFTGLPDKVSIGNPTFSKNSPDVIAYDYIDQATGVNSLKAVNFETGDQGTFFNNGVLNYPNYSRLDDFLLFDALDGNNQQILAMIGVGPDRLTPSGDPFGLFVGGKWGVWLAQGERDLVSVDAPLESAGIKAWPSPFDATLNLEFELTSNEPVTVQIYDLLGRKQLENTLNPGVGQHVEAIDMAILTTGTYVLQIKLGDKLLTEKIQKIK